MDRRYRQTGELAREEAQEQKEHQKKSTENGLDEDYTQTKYGHPTSESKEEEENIQ